MKLIRYEDRIKKALKIVEDNKVKRKPVVVYTPKKYLYTLEAFYNDFNYTVVVTDILTQKEVEKRVGKIHNMENAITKVSSEYKRLKVVKPLRILKEIKLPDSSYKPEKKSIKEYSSEVISTHQKFVEDFQELMSQLDYHRMRVDVIYTLYGKGKYKIDITPKSSNMAKGLHRVILDVENKEYKYFYGAEITSLKLICKTDKISKLFTDE
jgi:hypothetical protein